METFVLEHFGEFVVGAVLLVLSWAFKNWSNSLKDVTEKILGKLDYLTKEFHAHRVEVERRVTRVETRVGMHYKADDED